MMEKIIKTFPDGEVTKWKFANNNEITIVTMKLPLEKWSGNIGWKFGTYVKELYGKPLPLHEYKSKQIAQLKEALDLYISLEKHRNKSEDKKLLIQALITIIHDIKQLTLF